MKYFFTILLFCGTIHSQISITQSDVSLYNIVGTTSISYFDSTTTSADIGNTGESSWDFSALTAAWSFTTTIIDPSTSPYQISFPNSPICRKYTTSIMGFQSDHWIFNSLSADGFFLDGIVTASLVLGFSVTSTTTYNPSEEQLKLPLIYGTSWSHDYSYSTVSSTGGPATTTNSHVICTVDAYGLLTLPGGATGPALRMKRDETSITNSISGQTYSRSVGYIFYTLSGNSISVSAADTLQLDHGIINVSGAGWVSGSTTDIEAAGNSNPVNFGLNQNYPNPFNPSTAISFRLPVKSQVSLKVFDALGKEVAVLINEEKPAGSYVINFEAKNLSSGTYFYRLVSGDFVQMKKMLLLK